MLNLVQLLHVCLSAPGEGALVQPLNVWLGTPTSSIAMPTMLCHGLQEWDLYMTSIY